MPRHGICGIGRSNSSGGPPWTLSASVGGRKNKRGSRSMRLKLEVDEGITGSLCKNDGTRHQGPCRGYNPPWQTRYRGFDVDVAQRPMRKHHEGCYDAICRISRVARIASPWGWPPNMPPSIRV